jgi:cell shape-determining protein MreC
VVEGSGPDSCILKYLLRSDGMNPGDLVVTSGLDNIFPRGLPVARVKSIRRLKADISPQVDLIPVVDVTRLDELYVVKLIRSQPPDEAELRAEEEAKIEEEKLLEKENKKNGKKSPNLKKEDVKPAPSPASAVKKPEAH